MGEPIAWALSSGAVSPYARFREGAPRGGEGLAGSVGSVGLLGPPQPLRMRVLGTCS